MPKKMPTLAEKPRPIAKDHHGSEIGKPVNRLMAAIGLGTNVLFGYCPLARMLHLMPWNRDEPFTLDLLRRVIVTPPTRGRFKPVSRQPLPR